MELYHKKINVKNRKDNNSLYNTRYNQKEIDNKENYNKSIYLQKMLRKKNIANIPHQKNDLNLSAQNYQKVFNNMENLFTNENTKKKAIKYVIQIGRNKPIKQSLNKTTYQFHKKIKTLENQENQEENNIEMDLDLSITDEDDIINNKNINYTDRYKVNNRLSKSLEKRKQRNENKIRRPSYQKVNNDKEDLIKIIEELQEINMNLKKDSIKKNNEIISLKNELDNLQNELEEKNNENYKEIEKIYNNNNPINDKENEMNNKKLKIEYYKLLQQYDKNINDFNELKDRYNTTVDEYNNLKTEKNNLKNSLNLLKNEYN